MKPTAINGAEYYTVDQFAKLVNRSPTAIYELIRTGNRIRHLRTIKIFNKRLVLASELKDFPFTFPGKGTKIAHYAEGVFEEVEEKSEGQ
jgi:hypothetical protein